MNRDLSGSFGTRKYAFEELVAEISAAFCCAALGIVPTIRHADYIGSWAEVLRADNRAIVRAASQASKAADFLLGFLSPDQHAVSATSPGDEQTKESTVEETVEESSEKQLADDEDPAGHNTHAGKHVIAAE